MATVGGVDGGSLQVDSQPKSVGFVWGLVAAWHSFCIHQMNRVNSRNALPWQHYKHWHHDYDC